ncbi:MAG: hypothetical protein ABIG32_02175, partial [Candidatus Uhrbacteria bacterium]
HRPLLFKAAQLLWKRKLLGLLGILAGIVNTGAVLEVAFRTFSPVDASLPLAQQFAYNIIPSFDGWRLWLIQFGVIDPVRAMATFVILFAVVLILVVLAVRAQGALINGALTRRKITTTKLMRLKTRVFVRVLLIDLAAKIIVAALLAFSTIPLGLFGNGAVSNTIASFVVLVLFIAIMIGVSAISILAIISAVYADKDLTDSLHEAWTLLKKNPLYIIEVAVLLFLIQILGFIILSLALLVLWIPYLLAYLGAVLTTTTVLTAVVSLLAAGIAFLIVIIGTGYLTAYQYIVWALVYQKLQGRKIIPKLHRFRKTFRIF